MIIDFRCRPPVGGFIEVHKGPMLLYYQGRIAETPIAASMDQESMDLFWQEFDQAGVDKAVVMARHAPASDTVGEAMIAELVAAHPDRFVGFGSLDFTKSNIALADQVRGAIASQGLKGMSIEFMGGGSAMSFDDERLYPAYEACQALGVPAAFTTGPLVGARMDDVSPSRFDAIARDFPDLNIVLAHACYPYVTESIGLAMRHANVFLSPDCYTFSPGGNQWLDAANSILADQIIFATAYPIYGFQDAVDLINGYPFKPGNRERVFGENARRVLGI